MKLLNIPVYIPTRGRAKLRQLQTHELMTNLGFKNVHLVCNRSEADDYLERHGSVMAMPDNIKGIGTVRQWILEHARKSFFMLDDDISGFSVKADPKDFGGFTLATRREALRQLDLVTRKDVGAIIDRYVVARPHSTPVVPYGFMRQCVFIDPSKCKGIFFNRVQLFEDIDFSLQCLKAGLDMVISATMCINTSSPARTVKRGGCGILREKLDRKNGGKKDGASDGYWKQLERLHKDVIKTTIVNGVRKHRISWHGAYLQGKGLDK